VPGRDKQPSLARAARWDGLLPQVIGDPDRRKADTPEELAEIVALAKSLRTGAGLSTVDYDVILEADSYGEFRTMTTTDPRVWADAGATWWVESWWNLDRASGGEETLLKRLDAGPTRR
jgi:hypothetical protein